MISAKWHRFAAYCILVHMVPISASLHQSSSRRCSCILVACGTFFSVVICNKASNLVNLFVHEDEAVNCSPSLLLCTTLSTHLHLVQLVLCVVMLKLGCQQTFLMIWSATKLLIAPHFCFCARHYLLICILFSLYHVLKIYEKLGCLHPFLMI